MNPQQWLLLAALFLVGLSLAISVLLLVTSFVKYRRELHERASLLKRLENNAMLKSEPARKFKIFWSR
jgi:uncharacterized membrane protein YciS (DUF1049 family)